MMSPVIARIGTVVAHNGVDSVPYIHAHGIAAVERTRNNVEHNIGSGIARWRLGVIQYILNLVGRHKFKVIVCGLNTIQQHLHALAHEVRNLVSYGVNENTGQCSQQVVRLSGMANLLGTERINRVIDIVGLAVSRNSYAFQRIAVGCHVQVAHTSGADHYGKRLEPHIRSTQQNTRCAAGNNYVSGLVTHPTGDER